MKIRLIETAIPYSKVRKNVESIILPAISELGFTFSPYRTTNINAYETVYNGNYTDLNNNSTPISLRVNTTHINRDDTFDEDIFLELDFAGHTYKLGGLNSKDANYAQDLIDNALPNRHNEVPVYSDGNKASGLIQGDKESHTYKDWLNLVIEKSSKPGFYNWLNTELPDSIYADLTDEQVSDSMKGLNLTTNEAVKLAAQRLLKGLSDGNKE